MLNSFGGKFGERQNKSCLSQIADPHSLFNFFHGTTYEEKDLRICTDDLLEVVYTHVGDNVIPSSKTNLFVAAFTTCWARLKLYRYLDLLQQQVLYYDTDSVIYRWQPDHPSVPIGDFLGEMTDELNGDAITEFVSGGAKNYGYKIAQGKVECKVRGFTLNFRGSAVLNYETMKAKILAELDDPQDQCRVLHVTNPHHLHRDVTAKQIKLVPRVKQYGLVFDKRVVDPVTKTSVPFRFERLSEK